jgi:outer membrane protein insertion porin family
MSRRARAWCSAGRPKARCLLLAGLLVAVLLPGCVQDLEAQTPSRPEVVSLRFEGNESFGDRALRNAIVTRQTECRSFVLQPFCWTGREFALDRSFLTPRTFRADFARVQLFYYIRGYRQAQVDTVVDRLEETRVALTFLIEEGTPIRITDLQITGVADQTLRNQVARDLPIGVGQPLDLNLLDVARDTLTRRMRDEGYAHTDVLRNIDIDLETLEAQVEFDVYTGPLARFGEIEIVGNEQVSDRVIRRMLPFREGDFYSQEELFEAQRTIYNLEIFQHAAIEQDLEHVPDSLVPLRVEVAEGRTHRVRTGLGWNSAECFTGEGRWSSRNFRGGARRLVLRGGVSNIGTGQFEDSICSGAGTDVYGDLNWVVSAEFTQPVIWSARNSFTTSVFAERQSLQDVFVREAVGINTSMTRSLGQGTSVGVFYRPQLARLAAAEIFFCTTFLVCDPQDIDVLQASNLLAPVGVQFSRDETDRAFSPTAGYTLLFDVEHASGGTVSDFDYERAVGEVTWFHGLPRDVVLATRLRGGWLNAGPFRGLGAELELERPRIAHPQKRFYAGGANSVRGYAQNQLGPRVVSVEVEDLVFPVADAADPLCIPEQIVDRSCDVDSLGEDRFFSRPTGGSNLVEGSLELRFPVWGPFLRGVTFVDFGQVWDRSSEVTVGELAAAPGIGLRYSTPIGPVRVDLAYRPRRSERVPVVTSSLRPFDPDRDSQADRIRSRNGETLDWVRLDELAPLDPRLTLAEDPGFSFRRLQLHFSIGQAF